MISILRQSRSIAAHVFAVQVEDAHAKTFDAPYLALNICNRRHFFVAIITELWPNRPVQVGVS